MLILCGWIYPIHPCWFVQGLMQCQVFPEALVAGGSLHSSQALVFLEWMMGLLLLFRCLGQSFEVLSFWACSVDFGPLVNTLRSFLGVQFLALSLLWMQDSLLCCPFGSGS
jgi:hypothetical protein